MDFEVSVYEDVIKGQSPESWGHKGEICGFLVSTENAAERIPFELRELRFYENVAHGMS